MADVTSNDFDECFPALGFHVLCVRTNDSFAALDMMRKKNTTDMVPLG